MLDAPDIVFWMQQALQEASLAADKNEVPVGAVLVHQGQCLAQAHNRMHATHNPTMHAEMQVLAQATDFLKSSTLNACQLYVTLEPCPMCAHALRLAHVPVIYFGAYDIRGGALEHGPRLYEDSHFFRPDFYGGILEDASQKLLKDFFQNLRQTNTRSRSVD